ncbi:protein unc-80 homolog isoform X2 [Dreissena polymorpha]|uniref:protein unc-80 homolog isoform X2 n=1 Tax=Dreissena polymorpha TaxID=45954 RepID=UPI00226477E0|nr:protein unc-80 homolog isoform X2 [Dreissena polymorpha]
MPKRKTQGGDDLENDMSVPLPIQTFFWRQTSPFIRPKLGKQRDASCISFERVVVQNILHGQPPNLCEAIQSVSRWKVIQVAFPHVMHACASLLENRRQDHPGAKFSNSETKLLYTLHWIILDAASECEDTATGTDSDQRKVGHVLLHPLKTIQLFVYLFAPLVNSMEDTDFQSLKLENGLRLWQPMWDYQQPDVPCFSTPVKPQRNVLKAQRNLLKVNTNAANIYIGKGTSNEDLRFVSPFGDLDSIESSNIENSPSRHAPLARLSDSEFCFMSQSESQSVFSMCEFCSNIKANRANDGSMVCKCGRKDSSVDAPSDYRQAFSEKLGSLDREYVKQRLASAVVSGMKGPTPVDILSASYFDVAVLQSLFCLQWSQEGIHWALKYIHQRLLEISEEMNHTDAKERERSRSLPFSDPRLLRCNSIPLSHGATSKESSQTSIPKSASSTSSRFASMSPDLSTIPSESEPGTPTVKLFLPELRKEPPFKKVCMVEFRQFPDSTKAVVTRKSPSPSRGDVSPTRVPFRTKLNHYPPPKTHREYSSVYNGNTSRSRTSVDVDNTKPKENDGKSGKTTHSGAEALLSDQKTLLPSSPDRESEDGSQPSSNNSSSTSQEQQAGNQSTAAVKGPIITITADTPQKVKPSWPKLYDFPATDEGECNGAVGGNEPETTGLSRSQTDSNICYKQEEEVHEVAGAIHYIQKNGHLNYKLILQAIHFVTKNQSGDNICEVALNILSCLLDLGIIEHKQDADKSTTNEKLPEDQQSVSTDTGKNEIKAFNLAMDSLISIYKSLGCPHGCGDGLRGRHGDLLRQKGHNCLLRLQRVNSPMFSSYIKNAVKSRPIQEVVDFYHAFLGFCVDPVVILQSQQTQKKSSTVSASASPVSQASGNRKSVSTEVLSNNTFANNFGHPIGGVGYRGVEGVLMANSMKTLVSRCMECSKDLYSSDNISLFCDIRQLITYFKEVHGGTFRRVALSGLLDAYFDLKTKAAQAKEVVTPTSFPISRTTSVTSDSGDEKDKTLVLSNIAAELKENGGKSRKSIFRKKIKKQLLSQQQYAASDSEVLEEMMAKSSPRASLSCNEDDTPSGANTPRRKFSKFHIGWRKPKSDHEEDSPSEVSPMDHSKESKSETGINRHGVKGKMSFKTASQATLTFLSARRRIEGGLKSLAKKAHKAGHSKESKQPHSENTEDQDDVGIVMREKKLVDKFIIKSGMLRFSFLLECCHPGSVPDPQLLAAMIQLDAPVSARATLLLECAHFVHRCNHGDWPNWMRLNLPSFRHSSAALHSRGQPSGVRRTLTLQKAAGRLFYSWAENLGYQLEYMMAKERQSRLSHVEDVHDERKKRQLRMEDDTEDFLDENTVNQKGTDCPYALKMLACLVLQEITTFLRETFQYLPRKKHKLEPGWDKHLTSRRYSSIISSPGHSDRSSESNIGELPQSSPGGLGSPGDRKISFAVQMERSESLNSSQTSLSMDPLGSPHTPTEERKGRRLAQGRQKLLKHLRRGSIHMTSFRQRSFHLRRGEGGSIKLHPTGSIRDRKISSQSIHSDSKCMEPEASTDDFESMTFCSDEPQDLQALEEQQEVEDERMYSCMPWIKVVIQLSNQSNFICPHQGFCHLDCYERQRRSCSRLVTAMKKIYQSTEEEQVRESDRRLEQRREIFKDKFKRRESIFQNSSPIKRRESTPLLEKIRTDVSLVKQKLNGWKKETKPKEAKEDLPIVKYITSQAQKLTQCPLGILSKAAPILNEDQFADIMPVAWELMMETDQEVAAAAASMFLIASVRAPEKAQTMVFKELQHEEPCVRINAVLRFGTLWKFRHQAWPRMEEGAQLHFKVPPPNIDFTLPSPTIGLPSQLPIDPPWSPHFKAKIEEVTVNQDQTKSLVTATTTRRKQQQEMIRRALQREEERKRIGRETFPMTTVSVTQLAAVEPSLHHIGEDHEEALQEEISLAARRVSLAPTNRNLASRSMSWRNGSLHWARLTTFEGDEERQEHGHHVQLAEKFFPSSICTVVLPIIHLLDDGEVSDNGVAVNEVAEKVIWNCIVEDPVLFMRHFLEKITHREKHEELLFLLRKLVLQFRDLPSQMAHSLFNYLIGYVMFYVRTPQTNGQEAIGNALALLWQVVPNVEGIYFKDLKQTLKKEQCDPNIMISANVPSAKKIIVHGPDLTSIPSQFPIHEDTQFNVILQDSLDFFNIPDEEQHTYFLVDTKSNQIHNLNSYVRDFYFFRRNFYPQLSLVHMDPAEAKDNLEKQALLLKFGEIGKVLFTVAILESTSPHQMQNHISFLHEELVKLPSFPRKALDAEFSLYNGNIGKELFGLDTLHKSSWLKLMHTMFSRMTCSFNWSQDLCLFLNVINGCIILHCEDSAMLRYSLATVINASIHFKHIFSMNGFLNVVPTLLRTYSNHLPNPLICKAIQFVCKQFYILHRKPFMLQLFGSLAPIIDFQSAATGLIDTTKVQPNCLFDLLLSLEKDTPDVLGILNLIEYEVPFKALDFCYENDPDTFNILQVIDMCVTVVVYSPESFRSIQMLTVLEIVLPRYLDYLKMETNKKDNPTAARNEVNMINAMGSSVRALITSCDFFSRTLPLPRQFEVERTTSKDKRDRGSPVETSIFYDDREDSNTYPSRYAEEGRARRSKQDYDPDDEEMQREDFRKPRDSLLNIVAEFYVTCQGRMKEIRKMLADSSFRPPELLDHKSHNRLADMAHTLLKLATFDPDTMGCAGLQRYMTEILPITDWSQESVRPALNLIMRRLDRLFNKINNPKRPHLKRKVDWTAAANLLKGVFLTLKKFPYLAHLPHLKTLISALIQIVLSSGTQTVMESLPGMGVFRGEHSGSLIPPMFCSEVVKLVAMQMQALGYRGYVGWMPADISSQITTDQFSLEQICGGMAVFPTSERCINMLVNFILPLCIRVGCGRRDTPKLRQVDINFALQVIINVLSPPTRVSGSQNNSSTKSAMHHLSITEHGRCGSMSNSHKGFVKYHGNELLIQTAYLGLEILMSCFDRALAPEWHRVAKCIINNSQLKVCISLWKFLNFIVTHRPSIFLMLQPFIQFKMLRVNCDTAQEYYEQQTIKDKMHGYSFTHPKCVGTILVELALELKQIREEFIATGGEYRSRSATMVTDRSEFSHTLENRARAEVNEITTEIIGPPKPTLATIGKRASRGTILSQGSSGNSVPFKVPSFESGSQSGRRQSIGQRISAKDGMRILEKFKRPTQDDLSPIDQVVQESEEKVQTEPTFAFQPALSEQNSLDESPASVLYENEDGNEIQTGNDLYPREHRLQRQDAKSRKTFKMKRTRTKTTSARRLIRHGRNDVSDTESNSTEGSPTESRSTLRSRRQPENESLRLHRTGTGVHKPRSASPAQGNYAKSVEAIHNQKDDSKKASSRPRYIQRSKSHDDPQADIHAPAGTARGRIARQGARIVKSRSPSSSPIRILGSKSPNSSIKGKISSPPLQRGYSEDIPSPTEFPAKVLFSSMPGPSSPPSSSRSLKEEMSHFRFSLKKKEQVIKENESESSASSPRTPSINSQVSPSVTSPLSPTNPFLSLIQEKPSKTSPQTADWKTSAPKTLVQSRIQMFSPSETIRPQASISPIAPPPVYLRQQQPASTLTAEKPPTAQTCPPEVQLKFRSRDRQRPFSPKMKQRAISKLLHDLPVSDSSAFHAPQPRPGGLPSSFSTISPLVKKSDSPLQHTSSPSSGTGDSIRQSYISSRCSSEESLTEFSSLLKEDEKSHSRSSVCVYFDGKHIPDTLV